jgi:uncharacterized delta-60 repeat protein
VQADGKIIAGGYCEVVLPVGGTSNSCVARINTNGSLDSSFGNGGTVKDTSNTFSEGRATLLQPDGKIVLAGPCRPSLIASLALCVFRYNLDGSLDPLLSGDGIQVVLSGANAEAYSALPQADGKILIAGRCTKNSVTGFCLTRLDMGGELDGSFGAGGTVVTAISGNSNIVKALLLQPDGKILAAGECDGSLNKDFCVVRYDGGPFAYRDCPLDIDGDSRVLATTDSLIMTRIALGMRGNVVVNGINFPANARRTTWTALQNHLVGQCGMSLPP